MFQVGISNLLFTNESNFINGSWYWEAWKGCVDTVIGGGGRPRRGQLEQIKDVG